MRVIITIAFSLIAELLSAQADWTWQLRAPMPMPSANNAVCAARVNGDDRVYSFGGIGAGLDRTAVHRESYRYSAQLDAWVTLAQIPDTSGKIASAASVVGDVAYVTGGYHVLVGSPFEVSSNKVHRFDLIGETWLSDGTPIPVPIDDHVQAVWRDSLIYVITGWSNTTNVPNVQIYDPAIDTWSVGTPVPNSNAYRAFGASGTIIGDTIFYYGGASTGSNFPTQDKLRIGVIDALDPTIIAWLPAIDTGRPVYRSACGDFQGRPFWVGGSAVSYNYDAVAYNGSGVVAPIADLAVLSSMNDPLTLGNAGAEVMDMRGLGQFESGEFHVCGGIGPDAQVLSTNWLVSPTVGVDEVAASAVQAYPIPSTGSVTIDLPKELDIARYVVFNAIGAEVASGMVSAARLQLEMANSARGSYTVKLIGATRVLTIRFWLV